MPSSIVLHMRSPRNASFHVREPLQGYTSEEWHAMSEDEREEIISDWVWEQIDVWVEGDNIG